MTDTAFTDEELTLLETITREATSRFIADNQWARGPEALKVMEESRKLRDLNRKIQGFCIERLQDQRRKEDEISSLNSGAENFLNEMGSDYDKY